MYSIIIEASSYKLFGNVSMLEDLPGSFSAYLVSQAKKKSSAYYKDKLFNTGYEYFKMTLHKYSAQVLFSYLIFRE